MTAGLETTASIVIAAPRQRVWDALTTPEVIKRWFFGVDTHTDWKPGSSIVHTGEWRGRPYDDKGTIVRFDPPERLVHTHWSAMSGVPDAEENYQTVTWTLAEDDGRTRLTVHETNLPSEQAKATSEAAWGTVLQTLREVLER